jgi:hypothetical protein
MTKKKMGGLKLSAFSGIQSQTEQPETEPEAQVETLEENQEVTIALSTPQPETSSPVSAIPPPAVKEKPVTINIKISRQNHEWLTDTSRTVRDNNLEPVPPSDRVYPQHLISVAIELLFASDVDWSIVKNVEDLKQQLNI